MCFCVHLTAGSAGILHPHSVYIPLHHCHGVVHSAPQYPSHYLPYTKVRYHVLPKLLCIGTRTGTVQTFVFIKKVVLR